MVYWYRENAPLFRYAMCSMLLSIIHRYVKVYIPTNDSVKERFLNLKVMLVLTPNCHWSRPS